MQDLICPTVLVFSGCVLTRVAQNAQGVVKGVIKGVTRASFGRRAPLTPQQKGVSKASRREILQGGQQDSAGGGCAPWLGTRTQS